MTTKNGCGRLHSTIRALKTYPFPAEKEALPKNGVYFLFEVGEVGHDGLRIVRIGSHTGANKLPSRLFEHTTKNKDRSIFRKNIGRTLLNKARDPFLEQWNWDLTTSKKRKIYGPILDIQRQQAVEDAVSQYIVEKMTFAVLPIHDDITRLEFEKHAIATVAQCPECRPSQDWLGNFSPVRSVCQSGLWLKQHLTAETLSDELLDWLERSGGDSS